MFIKQAVERTKARFGRLYDTLREEYWRTRDYFEDYGCSLGLKDVNKRATITAIWASLFIFCVTLPVILYHRGFSSPPLFVGLAVEFGLVWILVYILVFVAHILWVLSFIVGSTVGGSDIFLNYVGKRWGKRIDEITSTLLAEKTVNIQKTEEAVEEKCASKHNNAAGDTTEAMNEMTTNNGTTTEKPEETAAVAADKNDNENIT